MRSRDQCGPIRGQYYLVADVVLLLSRLGPVVKAVSEAVSATGSPRLGQLVTRIIIIIIIVIIIIIIIIT